MCEPSQSSVCIVPSEMCYTIYILLCSSLTPCCRLCCRRPPPRPRLPPCCPPCFPCPSSRLRAVVLTPRLPPDVDLPGAESGQPGWSVFHQTSTCLVRRVASRVGADPQAPLDSSYPAPTRSVDCGIATRFQFYIVYNRKET